MMYDWKLHHFYADPHIGHRNIIRLAERPFADLDEMHKALVERYNAQMVGPFSQVLWVGDAFFGPADEAAKIIEAMHGRKFLVMGNHDKSPRTMAEIGFTLVTQEAFLSMAGRKVRVSHYPYAGTAHGPEDEPDDRFAAKRPPRIKGEVLVHGHTHSRVRRKDNMIHVGVDAWDYRPASWAEVEELVRQI